MQLSFLQILITLFLGIGLIIFLTTKLRVHAFFALLFACLFIGLGLGLSIEEILTISKAGFGTIIGSLSLIIIFGTTLGILMENTGATIVIADWILKLVGKHKSPVGMNIIGYIVGLPIFCDSGYIVLSGLNSKIAIQTGKHIALISISLAAGLYAVHNLVPPHPGPAAATAALSVNFGLVFLFGILVAIPTALSGLLWAKFAVAKLLNETDKLSDTETDERPDKHKIRGKRKSILFAVSPIIVPIVFIGLGTFTSHLEVRDHFLLRLINIVSSPDIALGVGCILAFFGRSKWGKDELTGLLERSIEKSGNILLIIGAGGALGAVIASVDIVSFLTENEAISNLGILFPFIVAATIKTAQGSSTVAIITTATLVSPMLNSLKLDSEMGRTLAVLSIGAGGMVMSHANDSYFWVISKFSNLKMKVMLRVYSLSTLVMGITAILCIQLIYWFLFFFN